MDSQIVKAMLKKESYGFNTFVPVKVREIKSTADPNDLFLIEGEINMADQTKRQRKPTDSEIDSKWQRGPKLLQNNGT